MLRIRQNQPPLRGEKGLAKLLTLTVAQALAEGRDPTSAEPRMHSQQVVLRLSLRSSLTPTSTLLR